MDPAPSPSREDDYRRRAATWDPYDPWMGPRAVAIRRRYYAGELGGRLAATAVGLADWVAPAVLRRTLQCVPRIYPITVAQLILSEDPVLAPGAALDALLGCAVPDRARFGSAWGLGFPWMSKNGLYDDTIPFVTHTPYAMEALLELARLEETRVAALRAFDDTWIFLKSLLEVHRDECSLALSYAPVPEPRIVINANAYAAYAYALHASQGIERRAEAETTAIALIRYVIANQRADGSWRYYADELPGNFIDCFHSCFVLKNLIKTARILPAAQELTERAVRAGKAYLENHFLDRRRGLVRRFVERDIKDPFVWDLYDQAEYLGLLIDCGEESEARSFLAAVRREFVHRGDFYSRIDLFGRRWGKNFLRWGVVPLLYHESRLKRTAD